MDILLCAIFFQLLLRTVVGCDGVEWKIYDACGICGGNGSSCASQGQVQGRSSRVQRSTGFRFSWRQVWTPCSVSCGVGQRRRVVLCVDTQGNHSVRERRCRRQPKPYIAVAKCVQRACKQDLQGDDPTSWSLPSGTDLFKAHFGDLFSDQIPTLPKFHSDDWGECSVTCGKGTRSRQVTCKLYNAYSKEEQILSDSECFGNKPRSVEVCDEGPCQGDLPSSELNEIPVPASTKYRWHVGEFTDCSRSCLGGTQESKIICVVTTADSLEVSPALCAGLQKPAVIIRDCNFVPCPPRWDSEDYGPCSKQCGGGVMRRKVRCLQEEANGTLTQLANFRCPDPVPITEMSCNNIYCPSQWATGDWTECSKTCGVGVQGRRTFCIKEPVAGHKVTVSDTACMGPRPAASRRCSVQDCPQDTLAPPFIKAENYTFIQLRRAKKVKLVIGGKMMLLPGQFVSIRCPVKNYPRRLIFWSKSFKLIPMAGRVRATFNGNLKIRKANPAVDAGTYTCMAGSESAEVHLDFLSRNEAVQKIKDVTRYLQDNSSRFSVIVKPGEPKYQDGVVQDGEYNVVKKFVYMTDDWSSCSVTCGSGQQKRRVTCSRITNKYVKILPDWDCEKMGLTKPEDTKKCSHHLDCPQWVLGAWTECSVQACVRESYAERHRKVDCAYSNGTSASHYLCDQTREPEAAKTCVNLDCIAHWTTSNWTPCRPSCGQHGTKVRMLTCTWRKTGLPAWTTCNSLPRPNTKKICKVRPCPRLSEPCVDNSRYCSLARMLMMCRYDEFRRKCCKSCTQTLQSTLS